MITDRFDIACTSHAQSASIKNLLTNSDKNADFSALVEEKICIHYVIFTEQLSLPNNITVHRVDLKIISAGFYSQQQWSVWATDPLPLKDSTEFLELDVAPLYFKAALQNGVITCVKQDLLFLSKRNRKGSRKYFFIQNQIYFLELRNYFTLLRLDLLRHLCTIFNYFSRL